MPIDPDNPLLTSYAFGELDSAESTEVESLLAADESARRFVGDLRATAALLQDELAQESSPGLDDARRAVIFAQESETVQSLRLQLADADDAEPRTDVYRVITHPSPRAGRDRRELLAIAASVAIVATTLTLIFSSLFRGPASPSIVTNTQPTSQPLPLIFPQTQVAIDQSAEFPDSFTSRPPRDLLDPSFAGPETSPLPFGVNSALSVTRIQIPSTHESPTTAYAVTFENPFVDASRYPLSTFSFDVGNNSYAAIRGALNHGRRPDKAVE